MGELFGTDGIRGKVNQYPMTPEMALRIGKAAARYFQDNSPHKHPKIVIGKDTRLSGDMLESALVSGLCAMGADVYLTGILPTPGVAYLTKHLKADAGIVVSASHNPFYDNGIKFFNNRGFKLSDTIENDIEELILHDDHKPIEMPDHTIGKVFSLTEAGSLYSDFLIQQLPADDITGFKGLKIAIDCANGATSMIAPDIFERLGMAVVSLAISPDGMNINDACGSQYPDTLSETVTRSACHIGFAFDGDGDRLIAVDETGKILTGDQLIAVFAHDLHQNNLLSNQTVVTTVMSNLGLGKALAKMQIQHLKSAVGDRYVMQEMVTNGAVLGGEDSGHLIFLDMHTTGDGLLAALQFMRILASKKVTASTLAGIMTVFPQTLLNVTVRAKPAIEEISGLTEAIAKIERQLGNNGRVLIRYSGTQPMCRVMVEAATEDDAHKYCKELSDHIQSIIGE
jgi:phosphoglucosamine mutase